MDYCCKNQQIYSNIIQISFSSHHNKLPNNLLTNISASKSDPLDIETLFPNKSNWS